ncbi:hypothetical protein [Arenibaculum sp.]|jgi:hypothetical protein|uniref:hypothetical protein n=1 Tax=Arenibaculum sp. TaxID=2865862 RepID=UPI002E0E5C55|nr:hypothetical protein [Arenibaculum sp.]
MNGTDSRKEAREVTDNPIGERPQDQRSREEVVKQRDARHLADEAEQGTGALEGGSDTAGGAGGVSTRREGPEGKTPDGKPYGEDWDPDAYGDKGTNVGGLGKP